MTRGRAAQGVVRLSERRRRQRIWFSVGVIFLLLVLLAGLVALMRAEFFRIAHVSVTGTSTIDPATLQASAQSVLTGWYLYVVPRSNTLLYPKQELVASILANKKCHDIS